MATPGPILAIDPGTKRIGFAVSDELGMFARPLFVWTRRDLAADLAEVRRVVAEHQVREVFVGVPYKLEGGETVSTQKARAFLEAVRGALPELPVAERDEALTTWAAEEKLKAEGVSPEARKKKIDAYAAAVLLQEILDERAGAPPRQT